MIKKKKGFYDWCNIIGVMFIIISDIFLNVFCLRDLKIFVPEAVRFGDAVKLECQYDLEQAALYSVRWYFESEEFYRYVPKESPPIQTFNVAGISVDLIQSNAISVILKGVTRELSGLYVCEVSADAPYFHTAIKKSYMQVVEFPASDPVMYIDKKVFTIMESFNATCFVGKSHPPANITWFINGRRVHRTPSQRITYRSTPYGPTYSYLEVNPHSQILQDIYQSMIPTFLPTLDINCEVSIYHMYTKTVHAQLILLAMSTTTISPNLLGLEGSKHKGDPDNSPLTGHGNQQLTTTNTYANSIKLYIIIFLYLTIYL